MNKDCETCKNVKGGEVAICTVPSGHCYVSITTLERCPWPSRREERKPEPTPFEKWHDQYCKSECWVGGKVIDMIHAAWDAALKWKEEQYENIDGLANKDKC